MLTSEVDGLRLWLAEVETQLEEARRGLEVASVETEKCYRVMEKQQTSTRADTEFKTLQVVAREKAKCKKQKMTLARHIKELE